MDEVFSEGAAEIEEGAVAEDIVASATGRLLRAGIAANGRVLTAAAGSAAREVAALATAVRARHLVVGAAHRHDLDDLMHGSFSAALAAVGVPGARLVVVDEPAKEMV
jgi:hypothetical protein